MRFTAILILLAAVLPAQASVGVFTETVGEVRIQRADAWLAAAPGVNVEADDIIETGADSSTQMEMRDGSVFKLGAMSRLLLSEYQLDRDDSVLSAGMNVLSGWVRFAVAKLRSPERRYDIQTPTMTVGIRGTEGVLEAGNERNGLLMEEGEVQVRAPGASHTAVRAGQFVEHRPGQAQFRPGPPPPGYHARFPAALQARAMRRAHLLKARDVAPRHLRAVTRDDHERLRREHPQQRRHFEQRFRKPVGQTLPGPHPKPAETPPRPPASPHLKPPHPPEKLRPDLLHRKEQPPDKKPEKKKKPEKPEKPEHPPGRSATPAGIPA